MRHEYLGSGRRRLDPDALTSTSGVHTVSVVALPDEHDDAFFARILENEHGARARCVGDANRLNFDDELSVDALGRCATGPAAK